MTESSKSILIVEDDAVSARLLQEVLAREGYHVESVGGAEAAIARAGETVFDAVLTDLKLDGKSGLDVLNWFRRNSPTSVVLVMTAFGSMESAIDAMKEGAYDYLSKPFSMDEVRIILSRALKQQELSQEMAHMRTELTDRFKIGNIIGKHPLMMAVYKTIGRISDSASTVLLLGESGTGKELIARAIHFNSARADRPFVVVNCAAVPETLLESELFGYVKGAFTGAFTAKRGLFEEAHGGTCFLDEIGDMPLALQAKLLRVLQEHEIRRLGANETISVDIRIIAATNKDLKAAIRNQIFREDLYYRLDVVSITVPPLRERASDIPLLAGYFIEKYTQMYGKPSHLLAPQALSLLESYSWPGNVRELENVIERAVTLSSSTVLDESILPADLLSRHPAPVNDGQNQFLKLEELEELQIRKALEMAHGNKAEAAKLLGIHRKTLYRMAKRYGIFQSDESNRHT